MIVTVIITNYNYHHFLTKTIESVLAQSYRGNIEIIVVDDGSKADIESAVTQYLHKIILIRQANQGQSAAINTAFKNSHGEYIFLLDADDYWHESKIEKILELYSKNKELGLVHHPHYLVDGNGEYINKENKLTQAPVVEHISITPAKGDVKSIMLEWALPWMFNTTSSMSVPRWLFNAIYPLPEKLKISADSFVAPAAAILAKVGYLDIPLTYYRIHENNLWNPKSFKNDGVEKFRKAEAELLLYGEQIIFLDKILLKNDIKQRINKKGNWFYIKKTAMANSKPYLIYVPGAIISLVTWKGSIKTKIKLLKNILRNSVKNTLAKNYK